MAQKSPIRPFLEQQGFLMLDGGFATELEARGHDLNHALWSAHLLLNNPKAIQDLHVDYLSAGADCIISSSYQASIPGFAAQAISGNEARQLLGRSVELACNARDEFCQSRGNDLALRPLVAASIGPYGAFLADGSEYVGKYGISREELLVFHKQRWEILAESGADLLACETIPSFDEATVLADLLNQSPGMSAWVSFSCRDGERISDGTPITECASLLKDCEGVIAVGVNCTSPCHIASLISLLKDRLKEKVIVVYPNSGESYDAGTKAWSGTSDARRFGEMARDWFRAGARLIGGCCRTGPEHISAMKQKLLSINP